MRHALRLRVAAVQLACGFTLIEVMFAVAIGAIIILLALTAVRSAAQAVRTIQRTATENALIRSGWFLAMNDADFWHSNANPEYPYLRGAMSDKVDIAGSTDNPYDKRPFRRVAFTAANDPNTLQPNDPRSWYRNGMMAANMPRSLTPDPATRGIWRMAVLMISKPDPSVWVANNYRIYEVPAGWAPWHIYGDYSAINNVSDTGTRPAIQWSVFGELGHLGVYTYMPPGCPNIIQCPSSNRGWNSDPDFRRQHWYNWGEVPWSLADPTPTNIPVPSATDVPNRQRLNYALGNPGSGRSTPFVFTSDFTASVSSRYDNQQSTVNRFWLTDLDQATSSGEPAPGRPPIWPVGVIVGNRPVQTVNPDVFDTNTLIDSCVVDPWRALLDDFGTRGDLKVSWKTVGVTPPTIGPMLERFQNRTFHLPQSPTDAVPNLADRPASSPTMSTTIFRARLAGGDRAYLTILVENPDGGTRIELPFSVLGTTFRGARQHWGWKTAVDRTDLPPMGDTYVR